MKMQFIWVLCMLTYSTLSEAQIGNGKISGIIRDGQNQASVGATVVLIAKQDSSIKKALLSDTDGAFSFKNLSKGNYLLKCTFIGFQPYASGILTIPETRTDLQVPVIILKASASKTLQEVVVTAKKPLTEQKIDRLVVNVDAMLTAASSNALEVLAKSPGVMIDLNDNISLNGKHSVLVLIDDRPTYMSTQDLGAYLRSLPGGVLDKIELISNPPARYDAAGGAIINIVLKKNRASGFNGSLNLSYNQGVYGRSNDALLLNYRTKKMNVSSNIGYGLDQNFSNETYDRHFYASDGTLKNSYLQSSRSSYKSNGWNGRLGMDYYLSRKTTLGVLFTGSIRPKTDQLNYTSRQYNNLMQLDSITNGYTNGVYKSNNVGVNMNLLHKFDSTGKVLAANIDYLNYRSNTNQFSPFTTYNADELVLNTQNHQFLVPSTVRILAAKIDYTHPLAGKAEWSAGIKSSYVVNDVESNWLNQNLEGITPDYGKSNHFVYTENINSAYLNLKKEWSRWAAQVGLRIENTQSKGHQLANPTSPDSTFKRNYTWVFPSFYLSYKLDKKTNNILLLNYSKRIRRPNYQQLNPFLFFRDKYSYSGGNPNLIPGYGQSIDLRYAYKHSLGITFTYSWDKNGVQAITKSVGDQFITRFENFYQGQSMGIIPNASFSPTSWWTLNANGVFLYILNRGNGDGVIINQKTNIHELEVFNQFRLGKTWNAELTGFFPGKQFFAQTKTASVYNISAGIQKTILKGQGSLRLTINDLFYSMKIKSHTIAIDQVSAFSTRRSDTRRIGFSFNYRFGKENNDRKRNNIGGAEDEKGRTN